MNKQIEDALDRFRSGQDRERNFRIVFDAWFPRVFRFLRSKGLAENDARDLSQEVLFSVHNNLGQLESNRLFASWLFSAAETALHAGPGEFDFAGMPFDERPDLLREALDQLPPQTRQCLRMRLLEELDSAEIAKRMGISAIAVKARLIHARQLLRLRIAALREGNR